MPLNEQQQRIVDVLDAGVNVVAGAGTGKTFTLTERIVAAIESSIEKRPGDPSPYDHVLAITFTKKAAAELRSRVRGAFLGMAAKGGPNSELYTKCARNIDSAWISTIHSMAGRILRECAIELGIDPGFVTLTEQESQAIFARAVDLALKDVQASPDSDVAAFLEKRQILEGKSRSPSVSELVSTLLDCVGYMPKGINGVCLKEPGQDVFEALSAFYRKACEVKRAFGADGWPAAESKKIGEYMPALDAALARYEEWASWAKGQSREGAELILEAEEILFAFPTTTNMFGKKSDHFDTMIEYRHEYQRAAESLAAHSSSSKAKSLVKFAEIVKLRMDELKSIGKTKFTESDLLEKCNEMLADPRNSRILERYREQFDYIMLDEFQDTDKLQMDIVGKLCAQGGSRAGYMSNVCTVGDMQQSIYRFRGGDVEETQKRTAAMKAGAGFQFELSSNYRSHPDILLAVEKVFSAPDVFGEGFLHLDAACPSLDARCAAIFEKKPRIMFDFVHGVRASRGSDDSVSTEDARKVSACTIATRFKQLADEGVSPSRMAILLGRMTNAAVYSEALSAVGLEAAITGGSVFADSKEAVLVDSLLKHAVCREDDVVLLEVLQSGAFSLSDDLLVSLVRPIVDGEVRRRRLGAAFASSKVPEGISPEDAVALSHARSVLSAFCKNAREGKASSALRRLFVDSGMLGALGASLDAESLVSAGNLEKAARIVEDIERRTTGIAETSFEYSWHIATAKEAPGSLSTGGSDFVQIMTVHSSKGLEFDHVAVAEVREGTATSTNALSIENVDDSTYVTFNAEKADFSDAACHDRYKYVKAFTFEDPAGDEFETSFDSVSKYEQSLRQKKLIHEASSYEELAKRVSQYTASQELDEARRLLYVAMTRARESLLVSYVTNTKPESGYKGTICDIHNALREHFGDTGLLEENEFDIVQMPIRARRRHLLSQDDVEAELGKYALPGLEGNDCTIEDETIKVPVFDERRTVSVAPYSFSRDGICSYSSLSGLMEHDDEPLEEKQDGCSSNDALSLEDTELCFGWQGADDAGVATNLGTAFHRVAQVAIEQRQQKGVLVRPESSLVDAQTRLNDLTGSQAQRLDQALDAWFGSSTAASFASHDECLAEVPFSVKLEADDVSFVLEGEIDGLAYDHDSDAAFLVDYKTGRMHGATDERLAAKHLLQSQCYAYALLAYGFASVDASFVRVEETDPRDPANPRVVHYSYHSDDFSRLEDEIVAAYRYSVQKADKDLGLDEA